MAIPGNANLLLLQSAAAAPTGYAISRSIRLNSPDSAFLSRTPSTAGNRKTWTWAGWVKCARIDNGGLPNDQVGYIFEANPSGVAEGGIRFFGREISVWNWNNNDIYQVRTAAVLRDPSAWMHIVVAFDSTQATAADRVKIYFNGVQQTNFSTASYPALNLDDYINSAIPHNIGRKNNGSRYLDAYLADIHFCDGYAYDPSYFTEFDDNGILQPIAFTGSYGTNGFHLPFSDNSSAAALGDDTSGNNNDWTVNNITATATSYVTRVSATGTGGVVNYANAWDGNLATFAYSGSAGSSEGAVSLSLDFSNNPITVSSTVRVYFNAGGGANVRKARINGGSYVNSNSSDYADFSLTGTLTSIDSTLGPAVGGGYSATIAAIDVDGTRLISSSEGNIDSLVDVPTNGTETDSGAGGEVRGNYATLNPAATPVGTTTLSNGNLEMVGSSWGRGQSSILIPENSGKWYWEVTTISGNEFLVGMETANNSTVGPTISKSGGYGYNWNGFYWKEGTSFGSGPAINAAGTITQLAFDSDTKKFWIGVNGTWNGSGDPAAGTNEAMTVNGTGWYPALNIDSGHKLGINFGQRAFAYSAPSGFKALCTANSLAPVVTKPNTVFDTLLWTGNNASTRTLSGLGFSPDFVWMKPRNLNAHHYLVDVVRGDNSGVMRTLLSSKTDAEQETSSAAELQYGYISGLTSSGFSVASGASGTNPRDAVNGLNQPYVAWTWDAGSSNATNTDGSITSTVRANVSAGISIVSWTGNNGTVGHGLGVKPDLIITKIRNTASVWPVQHSSIGTQILQLQDTGGAAADSANRFNGTAATSSVFTAGSWWNPTSQGIAYCFAPVSGFSAFGSYTGNGSADGPFVFTGFRPRWVLIKRTDVGGTANYDWSLYDTSRDPYNLSDAKLTPNSSVAEGKDSDNANTDKFLDILSSGFKIRAANAGVNASGGTFVYACFAENPFALNARAR